jgi:hypothetical protein
MEESHAHGGADVVALESLERKQQLLRDHVVSVVAGYHSGYYLYGRGGAGKSSVVFQHLDSNGLPYELYNSRMTAKGLYRVLQQAPDALHVLEDMERLTKDPDAQGVLRSALWAQPGRERVVTWTTAKDGAERFEFRGGIIMISNRPLADLPELRALATRIQVHRYDVSDAELAAMMRDIAAKGHRVRDKLAIEKLAIEPKECVLVTEFLLRECRTVGCPLDLRLQQKAFATYLQFTADCSVSHWQDLIAASVREAHCHFRHEANTDSKEERWKKLRNIVRALMKRTEDVQEQMRLYAEKTGRSRADFFRKKEQVVSGEFDELDAG